jgi:hypothetical protein
MFSNHTNMSVCIRQWLYQISKIHLFHEYRIFYINYLIYLIKNFLDTLKSWNLPIRNFHNYSCLIFLEVYYRIFPTRPRPHVKDAWFGIVSWMVCFVWKSTLHYENSLYFLQKLDLWWNSVFFWAALWRAAFEAHFLRAVW